MELQPGDLSIGRGVYRQPVRKPGASGLLRGPQHAESLRICVQLRSIPRPDLGEQEVRCDVRDAVQWNHPLGHGWLRESVFLEHLQYGAGAHVLQPNRVGTRSWLGELGFHNRDQRRKCGYGEPGRGRGLGPEH